MPTDTDKTFEQLMRRHKDAVYRQMVRVCGNHDDAEDVLAESLMKAYRAMDQLEDRERFQAWLAQIGRRTCGRLRKKQAIEPFVQWAAVESGLTLADPSASQEDAALERELKECVTNALHSLPEHYREVYSLRDIDGLTAEETANRLNISVANVKSRLHRARRMLRENIDCIADPG
jgi:RNA polymerase sigma-70 factor (ECF subfamily)